jgi:hypothetical protein
LRTPEQCDRACQVFDLNDWGWEFLRRNEIYKSDWRATPAAMHAVALSDGTVLLRMRRRYPRAEKWGLFAFANPSRTAHEGFVLWLPRALRRTIRAHCTTRIADPLIQMVRLASFRTKRVAVTGVDGVSVITMKGNGSTTSLVAHGWSVLTRPARVTFELDGFDELTARIDCLRMLQKLADPASTIPDAPLPSAVDNRLRQALLALDGSLAGASYRQIATTIFGDERVRRDWDAASRFLKERTRRLVAKGRALMNGGYRELLR